ncbi:hypothetical protein VPHF99_0044 [Vibrio phage F99]|nr:hypothetical protein MYOV056v2_p0036 [Vibrio phage 184E37.3a]QZI87115.1 hypothetical protein MYOV085v1_p0093 [Vibrio phage 355E48.1]QZI90019.1 hypothetical protein MYOV057v1_p0104 [Vibrio phage 184E37.1]
MNISYEQYEDALDLLKLMDEGVLDDTPLNRDSCKLIRLLYENF